MERLEIECKKKAFKIRKSRFTPGCNANTQLSESEERS